MARYRVTVVGATGLVGQELVKLLYFPLAELRVVASRRSAGKALTLGQRQVYVGEARPTSFQAAFTASVRAHHGKSGNVGQAFEPARSLERLRLVRLFPRCVRAKGAER